MKSRMRVTGQLHLQFFDADGTLIHELRAQNKVVNSGLRWITRLMAGSAESRIASMAIGTGTTPPDQLDTTLQHESGRADVVLSAQEPTLGKPATVATASFAANVATGSITELALFLASGAMVARTVIPAQTKGSTTTLQVQWSLILQSSN